MLLPSTFYSQEILNLLNYRLYYEIRSQWGVDPPLYLKGIGASKLASDPTGISLRNRIALVRAPMSWADWVCKNYHYLNRRISDLARPMAYAICLDSDVVGMIVAALPHFPKKKGCFGFPGLPTQWQVVMLSRFWLHPSVQGLTSVDRRGRSHSFPVATCAMGHFIRKIQFDWLDHSPPIDEARPYHILRVLSYSDRRQGHEGTIYKASGFELIGETTSSRRRRHSPSSSEEPDQPEMTNNLMIYLKKLPQPDWSHNAQLSLFKGGRYAS